MIIYSSSYYYYYYYYYYYCYYFLEVVALAAGLRMTLPSTLTSPCSIRPSACRREYCDARAIAFAIRSPVAHILEN